MYKQLGNIRRWKELGAELKPQVPVWSQLFGTSVASGNSLDFRSFEKD